MVALIALAAALAFVVGCLVLLAKLTATKGPAPTGELTDSGSREHIRPGALDLRGDRGFWFDVVGESNYQGTLRKVDAGRLQRGEDVVVTALVVPEPDNRYDKNALAVHVDRFGRVGYFQRDESSGRFQLLGDRLRHEGKVGACEGKLIGGWDDDISIGIRLNILTPSEVEAGHALPPKERESERFNFAVTDWAERARVELATGKRYGLNLVDEYLCQPELQRLAAGRDVIKDSMGFDAVLVPDGDAIVVCAVDGQPVGRFGKGDVGRYAVVRDHLVRSQAVGACKAWIITERDGLGVRLSLRGPVGLEKSLGLLSVRTATSEETS